MPRTTPCLWLSEECLLPRGVASGVQPPCCGSRLGRFPSPKWGLSFLILPIFATRLLSASQSASSFLFCASDTKSCLHQVGDLFHQAFWGVILWPSKTLAQSCPGSQCDLSRQHTESWERARPPAWQLIEYILDWSHHQNSALNSDYLRCQSTQLSLQWKIACWLLSKILLP